MGIHWFGCGSEHYVQCQTNYENNMSNIRSHPTPGSILKNKII